MPEDLFNDLMLIRKGGPELTMGYGPTSVERLSTKEEWRSKADALRTIFRQTLGEHPAVDCPLDVRLEEETDRGDCVERRISYNVEPEERVASLALVPKDVATPAPAVLCIHQTQRIGKEEAVGRDPELDEPEEGHCAYALQLARRGYVTFAPDLLASGERIFPGRRPFDNGPLYEKHPRWSGTGKDLWDMGRALDVLTGLNEVDAERVGSIGHSQGGGITVYLMAVDDRVKVGVCNCGLWPMRIIRNPFNVARTGWWIGRPFLRPYCLTGKRFPVDLHELFALAAPRPLMNITALDDYQYTADDESFTRAGWEDLTRNVKEVYELLGNTGGFQCELHLRGHHFHADMRETAYGFVDRALKEG